MHAKLQRRLRQIAVCLFWLTIAAACGAQWATPRGTTEPSATSAPPDHGEGPRTTTADTSDGASRTVRWGSSLPTGFVAALGIDMRGWNMYWEQNRTSSTASPLRQSSKTTGDVSLTPRAAARGERVDIVAGPISLNTATPSRIRRRPGDPASTSPPPTTSPTPEYDPHAEGRLQQRSQLPRRAVGLRPSYQRAVTICPATFGWESCGISSPPSPTAANRRDLMSGQGFAPM